MVALAVAVVAASGAVVGLAMHLVGAPGAATVAALTAAAVGLVIAAEYRR